MPAIIYKNKEEVRLDSVTGIIGRNLGWNKAPLMYWSWSEGIEGRNYRKTLEDAASSGTIAHALIEADIRKVPYDPPDVDPEVFDKAYTAFDAWLEWKDLVHFKVKETELSLVSEKYQFGGTIDVAAIKKTTAIIDLKTSKAVYPDHKIQVAAYGRLYEENLHEKVGAYYILQLGKEDGSFAYHYWPQLDDGWEAFLHLLELNKLKKKL